MFTNGVSLTDQAWFNDTDTATYSSLGTIAGTNTITAVGPASMTAYASGQVFRFIPANTNTGATTINFTCNSVALGAKNIFSAGVACVGNELVAGSPVIIVYDGTQFNVVGGGYSAGIKSIQNASYITLGTVAGTNTITAVSAPVISAYAANQSFEFTPAATNTGATTINISSLGAKSIFFNNAALVGGELRISTPVRIKYDGTQFQLLSPAANSQALALLSTGTASTSATLDFTGLTAYAGYEFHIDGLLPTTNGDDLLMQVSIDNGSNWVTAGSYGYAQWAVDSAAGSGAINSAAATSMLLAATVSNNAAVGVHGKIFTPGLASATKEKFFAVQIAYYNGTNFVSRTGMAFYGVITAVNGIRFKASTGTLASGAIKCYGIRGS